MGIGRKATNIKVLAQRNRKVCHCEERSDVAIRSPAVRRTAYAERDSFAFSPLAKIKVRLGLALAGGARQEFFAKTK